MWLRVQKQDITLVKIYAPNIAAPKNIKQILTEIMGDTDSNIVIVWDFNIPSTTMNSSSSQKINKETATLNDTLDLMELLDTFRASHPTKQ